MASKRSGAMSRKKKNSSSSSPPSGEFGKDSKEDASQTSSSRAAAGAIYSRPALYDLAFGYRNYEEEVKFLLDSHTKYSSMENDNKEGIDVLELAAGPARHSITALRNCPNSVSSCTAVDISDEMITYSNEVADEELGDAGCGGQRDKFHYKSGDMRHLGLNDDDENYEKFESLKFDSVWILLGSMQHLTTNSDVISCFQSTYNLLREGGTMIIELPHPRETFAMVECTRNGWEVPLEDGDGKAYGELKIVWGDDDDKFDPIRQVRDFTVAMDLVVDAANENKDMQSVKEIVPLRLFTFQEIDTIARFTGFEVEKLHGALSDEIDVNNDDEAFRLVCVLKKL